MATIAEMLAAKGVTMAKPATVPLLKGKAAERFTRARTEQVITWDDSIVGGVRIVIAGVKAGETHIKHSNSWTSIGFGGNAVDELVLHTRVRANDGVLVGHAIGNEFTNCTGRPDLPALKVKIHWGGDGKFRTREKDRDNFNISFVDKNSGLLLVLQVSLVTRDQTLWVCTQELYVGQLAWLMPDELESFPTDRVVHEGDFDATILPATERYAHPFANPFTMFPECQELMRLAMRDGGCLMLEDCARPEWHPEFPDIPVTLPSDADVQGDWSVACVAWFNLVIGFGFAVLPSGEKVFIHFNAIREFNGTKPIRRGHLPLLHPAEKLLVKCETTSQGLKALLIVSIA